MKKYIIIIAILFTAFGYSQIIGGNAVGLVPMTTTEMNAIPTPPEGLVIYNTSTKTIWSYDGTTWNDGGGETPVGVDNQQLSFAGTTLTLEDGGTPIDLGLTFATDAELTSGLATKDGSETKITNGTNTTVTGTGTIGSPYQINVAAFQTLADVLTQGNVANTDIDLNENNILDITRMEFFDLEADGNTWDIIEFSSVGSAYDGDLAFRYGPSSVSNYLLSDTGTATQPNHIIKKSELDAAISGLGSGDVTAASNFAADNRLVKTDGGLKGIQVTGIEIDDANNILTLGNIESNQAFFNGTLFGQLATLSTLRIRPNTVQPTSDEGVFWANSTTKRPEYFDGTSWKPFLLEGDASGGGIVAEGTITTASGTGLYTVTHGLGYVPDETRIQVQELNTPDGFGNQAPSVKNITSTTFDIKATVTTGFEYAWRIFGTGLLVGEVDTDDQTAIQVHYDNTTSSLTATKVQGAIDELVSIPTGGTIADGYTFLNADKNIKTLIYDSPTDGTVTIPENATEAIPVWSYLQFYQKGAGSILFAPESATVIMETVKTTTAKPAAVWQKIATDEWITFGALDAYSILSPIQESAPLYDFNAETLALGALASWTNDGSGTATATQGTGANQPTVVDESGKKAVSFDGVDDFLTLGAPADLDFNIGTSDFTIIVVVGDKTRTSGTFLSDRSGTTRNLNIGHTTADNVLIQLGDAQDFSEALVSTTRYVYEISVDAGILNTYVDGTADIINSTSVGLDAALAEIRIGARRDGTNFETGSIRRILIYNRLLADALERSNILTELNTVN